MFLEMVTEPQLPVSVAVIVPLPKPEPSHAVMKVEPESLVLVKSWPGVADQVTELPGGTL